MSQLTPEQIKSNLAHYTGDVIRHRTMFKNVIFTPGVKAMAELCESHWLIDAIASHIAVNPKLKEAVARNERLYLQFWKLTVKDREARLECREDSGMKPVVTQEIEFTDFPLDEIDVWAGFDGTYWTLYLPSEH